jgi:hypothetical protein
VLGYFGASSVVKYNYLFDRNIAANRIAPNPNPPLIVGDCRNQLPGATNVRPEGF